MGRTEAGVCALRHTGLISWRKSFTLSDGVNCVITMLCDVMVFKQIVLGGIRGAEPGQLDEPRGIVVTAAGVWVVDMNNHRVCLFR